ncbi:MAG: NifB/NifX family molybdenum-iron cluster-binding protein [Methanomicrobiaceae archaeon]|nr:NifB/NifX family molybdenum-iron cluster-binding protein [Methanomicrobiaceae archaeon]
MKIGVAREGNMVSAHFGHCEGFVLFDVEDGRIIAREEIQNPGHAPGVLPQLMADNNVDVMLAGGMGPKAVDNFCMHGIEVYIGVSGEIDQVVRDFLDGNLEQGSNVCHH